MSKGVDGPSAAYVLARLVTGDAEYGHSVASVQRSHRFPGSLFVQIENLATMGGVPLSLVINQLIEAGLEAVKAELPPEAVRKLSVGGASLMQGETVIDRVEVKKGRRKGLVGK